MPSNRNAAAATNAPENDLVPATMYPVMIGAPIADSWLQKLLIPPTRPTLSRGAISDGMDHPTGAAAASPPIDTLIQNSAAVALCARAAPKMPRPRIVPPTNTVCRTMLASQPRRINASTNHPPKTTSVNVAHNHGTLV